VVEIDAVPRNSRDFVPPERAEPRPAQQTGVDERTLTPAEAATALERPGRWPGRVVDGVELAQIELMRLTTRWTDGRVTEGRALVFQYGADRRAAHLEGKPSLIITEGTSAEGLKLRDTVTGEPSEMAVQGLFVAIGHRPNTDIFRGQLEMKDNGYLITQPGSSRTNVEGVFVAGDVRSYATMQIASAVCEGATAALKMREFIEGRVATYAG
jgi:hypothetical protein